MTFQIINIDNRYFCSTRICSRGELLLRRGDERDNRKSREREITLLVRASFRHIYFSNFNDQKLHILKLHGPNESMCYDSYSPHIFVIV